MVSYNPFFCFPLLNGLPWTSREKSCRSRALFSLVILPQRYLRHTLNQYPNLSLKGRVPAYLGIGRVCFAPTHGMHNIALPERLTPPLALSGMIWAMAQSDASSRGRPQTIHTPPLSAKSASFFSVLLITRYIISNRPPRLKTVVSALLFMHTKTQKASPIRTGCRLNPCSTGELRLYISVDI